MEYESQRWNEQNHSENGLSVYSHSGIVPKECTPSVTCMLLLLSAWSSEGAQNVELQRNAHCLKCKTADIFAGERQQVSQTQELNMLRVLVPPPSRLDVLKVTIFCILNYIVYEMLHPVQYLHLT